MTNQLATGQKQSETSYLSDCDLSECGNSLITITAQNYFSKTNYDTRIPNKT